MVGGPEARIVKSLESALDLRMETLQDVLMGKMNPFERRLKLASRRQGLVFGTSDSPLASRSLEDREDESHSEEAPEEETVEYETADSVEIEVDSPRKDAIRAANALAEKHSNAGTVAVSEGDSIEVRDVPGGTFSIGVTEVLRREFGETKEAGTVESSVPSMSTAAAKKHG